MRQIWSSRSEILFIYDVKDANPNGDPLEANKPRMDEEASTNIVTDSRLKRTIRDYLQNYKGQRVFITPELSADGTLKTREEKLNELGIKERKDAERLLQEFIDLRLFGALIAVKERTYRWIGPVQFRFGRSLNKVTPVCIKGTSVLPSREQKMMGTFIEKWIVPYSLICFYGIINENEAKNTFLTEDDVSLMFEAMWKGSKSLITTSKLGHMPRLLINVSYKEGDFYIGDLDRRVRIRPKVREERIRSMEDYDLDITELVNTLERYASKIGKMAIEVDPDLTFIVPQKEGEIVIKGEELVEKLKELLGVDVVSMGIEG